MEVENRAMKQELVRTKSKISSLKREMSSIQQLHLAQQHVQGQFLTPTIVSNRPELQRQNHLSPTQNYLQPTIFTYSKETVDQTNFHSYHHHHRKSLSTSSNDESLSPPIRMTNPTCSAQSTQTSSRSPPSTINNPHPNSLSTTTTFTINSSNDSQRTRRTFNVMPSSSSSSHCDPSSSHSDEQLRLYLTETLQREKDSAV